MSKKTKEEKIIADYRKRLKLLEQINKEKNFINLENTTQSLTNKPITKTTFVKREIQKKDQSIDENPQDLSRKKYFLNDLKKSISIISMIITLEIIIYFASINRYLLK